MRNAWLLIIVLLLSISLPAVAQADPDPHMPDPHTNFCPGGGSGNPPLFGGGNCDGIKYPDGSYWHIEVYGYGTPMPYWEQDFYTVGPNCVVDNGSPVPAPPGGCDGAVQ
ncbi:hypothetical protein [Mycobacterium kubicae]|uniref:hypothetical protein n=1 Tax=Mycobacterium kubicae TaxID=120959 RepID=UPI0007FC0702|nr:hypothetical protein [Mycobacterium kubicae]OBK40938.1 hypothetical protein A5657_08890 [Mycobacterium kubicae]